jgi:hypothetical protein
VADVSALHPKDDVLRDVGGVVGDALEIARDQQSVEGLPHYFGALVHRLHQLDECVVFHAIDDVIHFEDRLGQFNLAFDERFKRSPNHGADRSTHASNVNGQVSGGKIYHIHHPFGDVDRLIANALKIGINLGDSKDETQIDSHGLLHGEQVKGSLVNFAFRIINEGLALKNHLAAREIAIQIGLTGTIHRLFRQTTHAEQLLTQIVEALLKARAHYPNLSYVLSDLMFCPNLA